MVCCGVQLNKGVPPMVPSIQEAEKKRFQSSQLAEESLYLFQCSITSSNLAHYAEGGAHESLWPLC